MLFFIISTIPLVTLEIKINLFNQLTIKLLIITDNIKKFLFVLETIFNNLHFSYSRGKYIEDYLTLVCLISILSYVNKIQDQPNHFLTVINRVPKSFNTSYQLRKERKKDEWKNLLKNNFFYKKVALAIVAIKPLLRYYRYIPRSFC